MSLLSMFTSQKKLLELESKFQSWPLVHDLWNLPKPTFASQTGLRPQSKGQWQHCADFWDVNENCHRIWIRCFNILWEQTLLIKSHWQMIAVQCISLCVSTVLTNAKQSQSSLTQDHKPINTFWGCLLPYSILMLSAKWGLCKICLIFWIPQF